MPSPIRDRSRSAHALEPNTAWDLLHAEQGRTRARTMQPPQPQLALGYNGAGAYAPQGAQGALMPQPGADF